MDQTQKIWYRRHSALLGLLVLGLATWFHTYWLPAPATRWQRDTTQLLKTDAIQLSGAQAQQDGQVTTQKHGATITWPAGQVHGVLQFQIAVHWSSQAVPVILQYCTEDYPYFDDDLIHTRSHRPVVEQNGSVQRLTWFLPDAAWSVRLLIPAQVDFRLEQAQAEGVAAEQIYWHTWRQAVIIGLYVVMLLLGLMELSRYLPVLAVLIRSPLGLLLASLLITGLVMILFLPPFQGPDENRHWKTAMELFRRDGQRGSILEKLPAILNAEAPRLRSERRFEAGRLFMNTPSAVGWQEDIKVTYTRHWGYPIIGLVALLFPPVTTVSEAIVFYYLCRCMNLLCLLLLVAYAWKLRVGSITLVMFLMLPLVIQQCVVISTDTAHNLGTLLALLLWMEHRRQKAWWSLLGLVIVSFLVLAAKPPIYLGILLLPAWFLPWRQVLQPKWLLVLVVLLPLMVSGGLWYLWRIVDDSRMHVGQEARQQLQYVLTPEGIQRFIVAGMEYPLRFLSPACWFGPLGWLDTLIAPLHQHLLWISLSLAVLADGTALVLRLRRTGVTTLGDWLEPILGSLMHALFLWWSLALVMYLTITPYQAESIVGMQVRYMIPAMLFFLIWPVGLWSTIQATPSRYYQNACLFLFLMTILRSLFLARDLLFRYWQ